MKLKYDKLLSSFAFKFNLRHYSPGLVAHFGLHTSEVGYLTSAYPLGMFGALFLWWAGAASTHFKPVLKAPGFSS